MVRGVGPAGGVACIGEAPGENEDKTGLPFQGEAGKKLRKMMRELGINPDCVFIDNCVRCRPPGNATPRPAELEACRPWLAAALQRQRPKIIVALGATAASQLAPLPPKPKISKFRGVWFIGEGGTVTTCEGVLPTTGLELAGYPSRYLIMIMFHPSYVSRVVSAAWDFKADLRTLKVVAESNGITLR